MSTTVDTRTLSRLDDPAGAENSSGIVEVARDFANAVLVDEAETIDRTDRIANELFEAAVHRGLFASDERFDDTAPHGGRERLTTIMAVLAAVAEVSPSFAKAIMDQNLGQIGMLRDFGEPSYAAELLSDIRSGRKQAAFAMTEPQGGSDPKRFTTTATETDGGYLITGEKDWITGAERRQVHFVVAKSAIEQGGIGVLAVDRSDPRNIGRITIGARKDKLGLRGLGEHHVRYERAFVPSERVVLQPGPRNMGSIMKHYNVKRAGQAAICIGATRGAMRAAVDYGDRRYATSPAAHANMRRTLARHFADLKAAETLLDWVLGELAAGDRTGVPSGMVKVLASEMGVAAISAAAQVCGANGLSRELPIERLFRDVRMLAMAGGATEVVMSTVANRIRDLV